MRALQDTDEVRSIIRKLVADLAERELDEVGDDDDFFDSLGLDSMHALELGIELEKALGIQVRGEDIAELRTVSKAVAFVVANDPESQGVRRASAKQEARP